MGDTRLIAGLGNPGKEYEKTRHNVGFDLVDSLAATLGIEVKNKKFGGLVGSGGYKDKKLILLKPQEYMNLSGQAVATTAGFYKLELSEVLIVLDDMALEPGMIRLRAQGSAGGHNGLADIIVKLGSNEFDRLRIGIGQSPYDARDYVLSRPGSEDRKLIDESIERAKKAVLCWLDEGIKAAMTKFNAKGQ